MEDPKAQRSDKRNSRNAKAGTDTPRSNTPSQDDSPKNQRNGNGKAKNNNSGKGNRSNKKDEERKPIAPIGNERFDNAHTLGGGPSPSVNSAHADALRLAEAVPPTSVTPEVDAQVRRILEIVPEQEYHVVYGVLEDCKFDEQTTTNYFLNKKRDSEPRVTEGQNWNSVVKKGLKNTVPPAGHQNFPPPHRKKDEHRQQNAHPQGHQGHPQGHQGHPQGHPQGHQGQAHYAQHVQHMEHAPEQIAYNLEEALSAQIHFIQQQSQMLIALQSELRNVTQVGNTEMQALIDERDHMHARRAEVLQELEHIDASLSRLDVTIQEKERTKNERLKELTMKTSQFGLAPRF